MPPVFTKTLVIAMIFVGEGLSIYAELLGAHHHAVHGEGFFPIFLRMFGVIAIAGAFLIGGYMLGYLSFRNIWIISVMSLTAILVMEPIISFAIFHQWPTRGAWVGLAFGIVGLISTLTL